MSNQNDLHAIAGFVALLSKPEDAAFSLLYNTTDDACDAALLMQTAEQLFRRIEVLSKIYQSIGDEAESGLSGLDELYVGDDEEKMDIETLWGQVDLQNVALQTLLKQAIKRVSKVSNKKTGPKAIRLLEDLDSDDEESSSVASEDDDQEPSESGDQASEDDDNEEEEPEDDEAKRMRERMQRTMDDMDDMDNDEDDEEDSTEGIARNDQKIHKEDADSEDPDLEDPAAEELNNGFFDVHEMEGFADEEEGYLPDTAYGEERPENTAEVIDKRSFHQKQRDGDFGEGSKQNDSDDDESEEDEEDDVKLFKKTTLQRRKNYREDDEVDALYGLYDDAMKDDEDDDDEEDDVINMTAADFFGKPDKKYFHKWEAQNDKKKSQPRDDDDSWNEFEFGDSSGRSGKAMWNEDEDDENDDDGDGESEGDESDNERGARDGEENRSIIPKQSKSSSKLETQIQQLEKDILAEKPWQMKGETTSSDRPVNSLLESTPEFEIATKMAPVVTVEHTASIEEMIKKRVLEEDWDDVVPRELPDVGWHQRRGELPEVSQEKSKLSLGELYEREYLKKATGYDVDAAEKETEEEKAINEMKALFANLCSKLDALSNYQFAPRPIEDEAEVRAVTKPAIAMEEVLPLHVSDARGVAPEEVYDRKHGRDTVLRADSELEQQERKRLRSNKKSARRKNRRQKEADEKLISRLQPGLGLNNPYEKRKMSEELQAARSRGTVTTGKQDTNEYASSTTFFKRLQQEAHDTVTNSSKPAAKNSASERTSGGSAQFKM